MVTFIVVTNCWRKSNHVFAFINTQCNQMIVRRETYNWCYAACCVCTGCHFANSVRNWIQMHESMCVCVFAHPSVSNLWQHSIHFSFHLAHFRIIDWITLRWTMERTYCILFCWVYWTECVWAREAAKANISLDNGYWTMWMYQHRHRIAYVRVVAVFFLFLFSLSLASLWWTVWRI